MSMRPARTTQADIARALRAVKQTGGGTVVEIAPDGTIKLVPGPHQEGTAETTVFAKRGKVVL